MMNMFIIVQILSTLLKNAFRTAIIVNTVAKCKHLDILW